MDGWMNEGVREEMNQQTDSTIVCELTIQAKHWQSSQAALNCECLIQAAGMHGLGAVQCMTDGQQDDSN